MITKERYKDYDPRVYEYMCVLIDQLTAEYGEAKDEWLLMMDLLAQNLVIYYKGYDDILQNGMYVTDARGARQRNPAITLQLNTQAYITKIISSMGWNIMSKSKIKAPEKSDETDSLFED